MVNERYGIAITETLHYLKGINQEDINKIPNKFMIFLKENALNSYSCKFDYNKPLKELNLTNETKGLIAMICLNYWCETEEQKIKFRNHLNVNEQAYQEELKRKYNVDDIFKKRDISNNEDITSESINKLPVEVKTENIFKRLLNRLKKLFNKK